jgi:hypothetical protein
VRATRTPAEDRALDIMLSFAREKVPAAKLDDLIVDRPDSVLMLNEQRIALECRHIGPERLFEFHGQRMPQGGLTRVLLPWEPHIWAVKAIQDKQTKALVYRDRANASEVWLILHASPYLRIDLQNDQTTRELFELGARSARPCYERVFLIDTPIEGTSRPWEIWNCVEHANLPVPANFQLDGDEYPTREMWIGQVVPHMVGGKPSISTNLKDPVKSMHLQPLDTRFRVRYLLNWPEMNAKVVQRPNS